MAKISVIGAGVGGLSVAARLAKQGHVVEIYEASDRTGGKCRTEWFGDYSFFFPRFRLWMLPLFLEEKILILLAVRD